MRFTLRQLEYFVAACDAGSVTEAAQRIPVSQSSVSAAIAQLESALGVQLLIRHHAQGIAPTPAGRRFLDSARELLRQAGDLERLAGELTRDLRGTLELGCLVTLAPLVTPRLCHEFTERHPAVAVEVLEAGAELLLERLRDGTLALALTYDLELGPGIAFEALLELAPHALVAEGHPLASRGSVALEELAGEPMLLLDLPHSREYFHGLFAAQGLRPRVTQRSVQPEVLRSLVANGYGYTIVNARPNVDQALDGGRLATVPIAGDVRPAVLGLASPAATRDTRLVAAFREHCRSRITATGAPGLRTGP